VTFEIFTNVKLGPSGVSCMRAILVSLLFVSVMASRVALAQEAAPPPPPPAASPPPSTQASGTPSGAVRTSESPVFSAASVLGILPWGGIGIGARYLMPLPMIPSLLTRTRFKDGWGLEFGADYLRWNHGLIGGPDYSWSEFRPSVGMLWEFWVNDQFSVYPKVEAGFAFGYYSNTPAGATGLTGGDGFRVDGAVGLFYKFNNGIAVRAEAGYLGAQGGVAFTF
jgi:hypothetical protein